MVNEASSPRGSSAALATAERFFVYARKSTDDAERQVRSIDDQLAELRELATREGLAIAQTFLEKQTAKAPGRPIFNDMLDRIEAGEASGILAWHPGPPGPQQPRRRAGHPPARHRYAAGAALPDGAVRYHALGQVHARHALQPEQVLRRQPQREHPPRPAPEAQGRHLPAVGPDGLPQRPPHQDHRRRPRQGPAHPKGLRALRHRSVPAATPP